MLPAGDWPSVSRTVPELFTVCVRAEAWTRLCVNRVRGVVPGLELVSVRQTDPQADALCDLGFCFFVLFLFYGSSCSIWKFPGHGVTLELQLTPQNVRFEARL